MGALFALAVVAILMIGVVRAVSGGARSYGWLTARGVPARGILLQVDSVGFAVEGLRSLRIESRGVTIDVEIPGRMPYTVTTTAYVPRNFSRDVLPGATVEVRVDPRNENGTIAIVGPGTGFAAALIDQQRAS
ncbi:MAG TPA: hypothetical protein VMJ10_15030 [Kofleriaceae bacterium]|nr:hypothetical protein [Kofleriaceae bacterium]